MISNKKVSATLGMFLLAACLATAQEPGDRPKDSDRTKKPQAPVTHLPGEEELKREIAADPEAPLAWTELGWRLYRDRRYGEAEWAMNQARRLSPDDPYILWLSGLTAYQMDHFTDAKNFLKRVYFENKTWPPTIDMTTTYDLLGRLSLEDPVDLFSAAFYFGKACDEKPKDWQLQFMLGFTEWYRGPGRYGQALNALENARRLNSREPVVLRYYAWVKAAVEVNWPQDDGGKGVAEAFAAINQAIAAEPDFYENYELLARVHSARKQWREAETAVRRALALNPNAAGSHYLLAKILLESNTPASRREAEEHLVRAIALSPGYWEGPQTAPHVDLLAALMMREGRYSEAAALLDWRKRRLPNDEGPAQ